MNSDVSHSDLKILFFLGKVSMLYIVLFVSKKSQGHRICVTWRAKERTCLISSYSWQISCTKIFPLKQHKEVKTLVHACVCPKSLQSCLTPHDTMNCSPPGFSVHGDSPGKHTGVGYMPSSRASSRPRDQTGVSYFSCIDWQVLYHWCHLGRPKTL